MPTRSAVWEHCHRCPVVPFPWHLILTSTRDRVRIQTRSSCPTHWRSHFHILKIHSFPLFNGTWVAATEKLFLRRVILDSSQNRKKKVAFARDFLCFYFPIARFQGNTTAWWTRKGTSVICIRAHCLSQQQFIFYHDAFFIPVSGENKLEKDVTLYSGWEWESRVKPHNQGRANGNSIRTGFLVTLWVLCWMMVSPRPG